MKGDFSRWTFNPGDQFTRVLMQQGRVQLDADWNEQVAILLHTMRQMVSDMMGPHGTWDETAFKVKKAGDDDYQVNAKGRYYASGVLIDTATNDDNWQTIEGADNNDLIYLDAWERHLTYVEADEVNQPGLREVALKGADTTTRARVVWQVRTEGLTSVAGLLKDLQTKITSYWELVKYLEELDELPTNDFTGFSDLVGQLNQIINAFDNESLPDPLPEDEEIYSKVITPLYNIIKALQALESENPTQDRVADVRTSLNEVIDAFDTESLPASMPANTIYSDVITPLYNVVKALQALGTVDTTGAAEDQTITRLIKEHRLWQVEKEIREIKTEIEEKAYAELSNLSTGKLQARTEPDDFQDDDDCTIPPDAAYTGPENQLYRVEIHDGGSATKATFKWSRENGTIIFPINAETVAVSGNEVTVEVEGFGRDTEAGLAPDDWVELTYDALVEKLTPGLMFQVTTVDPITGMITLKYGKDNLPSEPNLPDEKAGHPLLRRWGQGGDTLPIFDANKEGNKYSHTLEKGIYIEFQEDSTYRTGDYWLIPARTATRDIEWPQELINNEWEPKSELPHGIKHYYAPLAIITSDEVIDCRRLFEQLGQPVLPDLESAQAQ